MNIYFIFIILMAFATANSQTVEDAYRECMDKEGASQEDADAMKTLKDPESRVRKCFYACMFELTGTSDGQRFNTEAFLEHFEQTAKDDERTLSFMREVAERCDGVENEDRCELAVDIVRCFKGGNEK